MNGFQHLTVLCEETVDAVLGDRKGCYVDATFGRGTKGIDVLDAIVRGMRVRRGM